METWENNIIAEKLNSLQNLPEGYLPNLASKWEIIEAGLPQQKRILFPVIKWASVAAAIISVIICSVLFKTSKSNLPIATKIQINKTIPLIEKTTIKSPEKTFDLATINPPLKTKKIITSNNSPKLKPIISTAKKIIINNEAVASTIVPIKSIETIKAPIKPLTITLNNAEITKSAKPKVYQKDFGNDIFTMDTGKIITQNQHTGFKIQLNNNSDNNSGQSSPVLQLQKSF